MNYTEFKPQAAITLCNTGGIEIMLNRSQDGIFYRFNHGQDIDKEPILEAEIHSSNETDRYGEAYFIHQTDKPDGKCIYSVYYLSEAMRLNETR